MDFNICIFLPLTVSFAGMGVLSWYLAGKLHLFDSRKLGGRAYATWIVIAPLSVALMVAISRYVILILGFYQPRNSTSFFSFRTMDNRHHWEDVLTGILVGLGTSSYAYWQYYPPLSDADCDIALGNVERRGLGVGDVPLSTRRGFSTEQDREPLVGV